MNLFMNRYWLLHFTYLHEKLQLQLIYCSLCTINIQCNSTSALWRQWSVRRRLLLYHLYLCVTACAWNITSKYHPQNFVLLLSHSMHLQVLYKMHYLSYY